MNELRRKDEPNAGAAGVTAHFSGFHRLQQKEKKDQGDCKMIKMFSESTGIISLVYHQSSPTFL
jgi:hypothetical protein